MTKIIGLTGGIGSGKTTVATIFKAHGLPVYIADEAGKEVMKDPSILLAIQKAFGQTIFENGVLDRKKLASLVFSDKDKLQQLNAIVHPAVARHFASWLENHQNFDYVIYESAILFESGGDTKCHAVITVIASESVRIQRVMQRDAASKEQIIQRMKAQWTDEQRLEKSQFVINNDSLVNTEKQVVKILNIL
ncbi:dephospho-CoA kinase [Flavobacterium succinicans]|uniref:Dephospho-CoA kinase n=1 Tax=Flavobacterium succinicans TaxID=29536 RepID=A0A1I4WV97_9FLAO|nr:dephospho-CoA kinase [Flavobacterium succinicans]SFN17096.1 dephospho-CoA kinase [Flavobacterium succinicans]